MSSIDNRIVKMQFDNKQFESGVQGTVKSLENLKAGLNLDSSAKSLEALNKAGKSFTLQGISDGIDILTSRFSTLGIIGMTALSNITNSAINTGKSIMNALVIDPVKTGFAEYETQINAIQTILANTSSKGTTMSQVTDALDELNHYADKTIYNFTEMTRNIGTFTAAGVDLDVSVSAIKGIANLAAVSGSTSQQASTAMYQLSQALSSGTVKLQDWNSVVNAGMGGQIFQDALTETARVHGIAIDAMIKEEGSFRTTLHKGWLTSDILTETLSKFTGDLNAEQLKTMGYSKDQIDSIIELGTMANDAATKVKTFTQLFDTLKEAAQSGWTKSWEIIVGDFEEAKELLTSISQTFEGVIGASADARNNMLAGWKELGGRSSLIQAAKNAFEGLASWIKPVQDAFKEVFPPMTAERLYAFTEGLRELTERFKLSDATAENIKGTFKGFFAIIDIGVQIVSAIADGIFDLIGFLLPLGGGLLEVTGSAGEFISAFAEGARSSELFKNAVESFVKFLGPAVTMVGEFAIGIKDAFRDLLLTDTGQLKLFAENVETGLSPIAVIGTKIKDSFKAVGDILVGAYEIIKPVTDKIWEVIATTYEKLSIILTHLFSGFSLDDALDIAGVGAVVILVKKLGDFVDFLTGIGSKSGTLVAGIKDLLGGVQGAFEAWQTNLKADSLMKLGASIAVIAAALFILSTIDAEGMKVALVGMTALFAELFVMLALLQKLSVGSAFKTAKFAGLMLAVSVSLLILANAMKILSSLSPEQIANALVTIALLVSGIVVMSKSLAKNSGKLVTGAGSLILMAVAVSQLASVVIKLGETDMTTIIKGLIGLAGVVGILVAAVKLIDGSKLSFKTAVSLLLLATAVGVLASVVKSLGTMDPMDLAQGMLAITAVIAGFILTLHSLPKDMPKKTLGMLGLAAAMVVMSVALKIMGSMSWDQIARGLVTLAGALTIMIIAMRLMPGGIAGAAALVIMSGALVVLTGVLVTLGSLDVMTIVKGLAAIAGVFVILGVAALVLGPSTIVIIALAGAIALLGVGIMAIGGGLVLFSTGLAALAVSGLAGTAALVSSIEMLLGLIPVFFTSVAEGLVAFVVAIADSAQAIGDSLKTVVEVVISTTLEMITFFLEAIADALPRIIEAGTNILLAFLQGIADSIDDVVTVATDIIVNFLETITKNLPRIIEAGFQLIISFVNGLADSVRNNAETVALAGLNLATALIEGLIKGIFALLGGVGTAVADIGSTIIDGASGMLGELFDAGWGIAKNIVSGVTGGIGSMIGNVYDSAKRIGKSALDGAMDFLGIRSPSREFAKIGVFSGEGFVGGMRDTLGDVRNGAKDMGLMALNSISSVIDTIDIDPDINPTITPVLNMSSISSELDDFDISRSISLMSNIPRDVKTEQVITYKHEFDTLTVEGVNDRGEFVESADYAVDEVLSAILRRQQRL